MSLLAAQGIGVFNRGHAVIEASGDARVFRGPGTHVMTWLALRYWMKTPEAAKVVGGMVSQGGETIETWIANLPIGGPWAALGSHWLKSWGVDLKDATHDRGVRNRASYSPSRLYNARPLSSEETKAFVTEWWATFEPTASAPFEFLDRHLLRASLEQAFFATRGVTPAQAPKQFTTDLSAAKEATVGDPTLDDSLGQFLTRSSQQATSQILDEASRHDSLEAPRQHLQVISRATLLLRLASGSASELLARSGLSNRQIDFWITSLGEDRALWRPDSKPEFLTILGRRPSGT